MKSKFPFKVSLSKPPLRGQAFISQVNTILVVLSISLLPLLAHAGFWDSALEFGKNVLATAAGNYANKYQQDLTQLLQALRQPGTADQPFLQGNTPGNMPGNSYDPNSTVNQNPYGQTDPYAQEGYPQDPYGQQPDQQGYSKDFNNQQGYPNDPYAQPDYPQDTYGKQPPQQDPYAQQGYSQEPYDQQPGQQGYSNDLNNQSGIPNDPYAQPGYPQDPYAQSGYPREGVAGGTPVGLDVAIVKKTEMNGAETLVPIKDGDVLRDGRGNAQAGDKFRIMFRANNECYVYVIAIDGSAWAQGVFPNLTSPFANPVKPGQQYIIPENNNWLSLDQFKGIETLFFVASPQKRQDIEDILASIAGKERHPKATPQQVTEPPIIPAGFYRSQIGSSPFIIGQESVSPQGQNHGLIPTTYFTQKAGEALRVTRWFRHE